MLYSPHSNSGIFFRARNFIFEKVKTKHEKKYIIYNYRGNSECKQKR